MKRSEILKIVARMNNSIQIRVPLRTRCISSRKRYLLATFTTHQLRFGYSNLEDANRVIGFNDKEKLTLRLLNLIKPGDVVLDIGASIGIYSIPAALKVKETGLVIAVESDPDKVRRLQQNCELNNVQRHVKVENIIAGTMHSVSNAESPLDDLFLTAKYPMPTIIKIDVDGSERSVLLGLRETLSLSDNLRLIQVEFDSSNKEIFNLMSSYGFQLIAFETHQSRDSEMFSGSPIIGNGWFARSARGSAQSSNVAH